MMSDFTIEQHEKKPFVDPFPKTLPAFAVWRGANGLDFILWHIKFILCNADADAYAYLMQWFGYILQTRCKPGVLACFYGAPECGKYAIAGKNIRE